MIVQGLLGIVMGGLTDRLGPRKVLTLCGILIGLGYLLMSQLGVMWQLSGGFLGQCGYRHCRSGVNRTFNTSRK